MGKRKTENEARKKVGNTKKDGELRKKQTSETSYIFADQLHLE